MKLTEQDAETVLETFEALQISRQKHIYILTLEPKELELYRKISESFPNIPLLISRFL